jgi:hypothetical protein
VRLNPPHSSRPSGPRHCGMKAVHRCAPPALAAAVAAVGTSTSSKGRFLRGHTGEQDANRVGHGKAHGRECFGCSCPGESVARRAGLRRCHLGLSSEEPINAKLRSQIAGWRHPAALRVAGFLTDSGSNTLPAPAALWALPCTRQVSTS